MATVRDLRPATRPLQRVAERVVAHSVDILRVWCAWACSSPGSAH
jgi:hypothetical protein